MTGEAFNYDELYYIRTRGEDDKRPGDKWGGYDQDFEEAEKVYRHEDVAKFPEDNWAIVDVDEPENRPMSLLVFDLDVHKAGDDFNPEDVSLPSDTAIVRSQNGGFHVYFRVHERRGSGAESEFRIAADIDWDVDIRGSYVGHHVVAPADIPGIGGSYELVNDESIKGVFDPSDATDRIRYKGEPLVEFRPDRDGHDLEFERDGDPPESMPTCYHAGLQLRKAEIDDPDYKSHKVNTLTALCGLASGYSMGQVIEHLIDQYPPNGEADQADGEKTKYHVELLAEKMDRGALAPPSIDTLREYGILSSDESCDCSIEYHGGSADGAGWTDEALWDWWSGTRCDGELSESSIIPTGALRHVAKTKVSFPTDELPEDRTDLPPVPYNKALAWVKNEWPNEADLRLEDDEEVTVRQYKSYDPADVHAWESMRTIYKREGTKDGRYAAVNLLRQRHEFLTPRDTDELHIYDPKRGVYDSDRRYDLTRLLDRELGSHYTDHECNEIIGRLKEESVDRDTLQAGHIDGTYLCVQNGVLDISGACDRDLLDHDPKYRFTRSLPVEYDPDATPTTVDEFLREITRREADRKTLLEMVGHALLPNYTYEKVLIIFGEGSNGKSTFFEVVRSLLGEDNTTSMALQKITDNRFAASNLVGKWANLGEDLPEKKIADLGPLKDLTGGGETWIEEKGKDGFEFRNRATMMFAANRPPVLPERSLAVKRRLVPIHFPYQFTTNPDDEHKDAKKEGFVDELTADGELSALLNMVLDGLDRLRTQGDVSLPESFEERLEIYEKHSDHIKAFRVDCLEHEGGARIEKSDVYNAYTRYCRENDYADVNRDTFWRQIRRTTLEVKISRPQRDDGSRPRVMENVTFTDTGKKYAPEASVDQEQEDTDDSQNPAGSAHSIAELEAAYNGEKAHTPYYTVTVKLESWEETPDKVLDAGGPVEKGKAVDTTGKIPIVDTDGGSYDGDRLESGKFYRLKDVRLGTYDGMLQLECEEDTSVTEIQEGVGHTPLAESDPNQDGLAAADGGTRSVDSELSQQERIKLTKQIVTAKAGNSGVSRERLIEELENHGVQPERANGTIEKLLSEGELYEPIKDEHYLLH